MQLYKNIMIRYIRFIVLFLLVAAASPVVMAQTLNTTSSPYSRYGLGSLNEDILPQSRAMGGIATGLNRIGGYSNINSSNPASYGFINLTAIDIGLFYNNESLNQTGANSQTNSNFRLSHVAFGIPVSKRSALSFGLKPYSELGYNYTQTRSNFGTGLATDTNTVNYIYNGEGGLSKAYLGYGFGLGKHIYLGANVAYLFGDLKQFRSTEIPGLYGNLNSRIEESNSVGGLTYDFGTQVTFDFGDKTNGAIQTKHLTFGYSVSASSQINTQNRYIVTQYIKDFNTLVESPASDTVINSQSGSAKIKLPLINRLGVTYQQDGKFLIGADYSIGNWSNLTIAGVNQGLQNSRSVNVGGQFTPNINAIHNYFATVDYRLGANYQKTYISINNTNINQKAVTFGLGLPLSPAIGSLSFYKINLSAEIGERGTLANGLIKEKFYNFHIGFMLNDKWFRRYKFD